ncbi:lactate utilization protein [Crassaminicella profunda]|uniref:lactate utilization protein n=1 Tax=Crassaminicella profunda TaxID=1286698 RepID=UPI001CA62EFA|nr:lactate utilization protein [Crassaminicella profunda]QZY54182.1 lactate utilization protein [Crassaminicella profunda]
MDSRTLNVMKNLKRNGFNVEYFENCTVAKKALLDAINLDEDVGIGGSKTIYDMGMHKDLMKRGNEVYWHWLVDQEKKDEERFKASHTPVYLSSSNAVTEDGKLVNIDGLGNRVASMIYGHDRVYIIVGVNKIAKDANKAIERIKKEACPKNAERLNLETPCRYTKECNDCRSKDRMCNITVIIDHKPMKTDINVFLINEDLGF